MDYKNNKQNKYYKNLNNQKNQECIIINKLRIYKNKLIL